MSDPSRLSRGRTHVLVGAFVLCGVLSIQVLAGQELTAHWDPEVCPIIDVTKAPSGHLMARPKTQGEELGWWILDTGASGIILDEGISKDLEVPVLGRGIAEGISGRRLFGDVIQLSSLSLGPLTLQNVECLRLPLGEISKQMKRSIAGVLGYDFFANVVAEVEMKSGSLCLHNPEDFKLKPEWPWQGLIVYERVPCIWAHYGEEVGVFRVDTGAPLDTVTFHGPESRRLVANSADTKRIDKSSEVTVHGAAGSLTLRSAQLDSFEFAGTMVKDLRVQLADSSRGAFADPYLAGNIGGVLLEPYTVYFHMARRKIAFVPLVEPKKNR